MSYSITISGHKDFQTQEEAKEFEEAIVEEAKLFVHGLDGVSSAHGSFAQLGSLDLQEE